MFPFKLAFENFMALFEGHKLSTNRPVPVIHYTDSEKRFVLYFKGIDWRYFTIILKSDIIEFGKSQGKDESASLTEFRINFLSHAVPVEEALIERLYYDNANKSIEPEKKKDMPKVVNAEFTETPKTEKPKEDKPKKTEDKPEITKDTPDVEILEESESYDDFIVRYFERWEKRAVAAIDHIEIEKGIAYCLNTSIKKTFGEFLAALFNGVNSLFFIGGVKRFVRDSMKEGVESVEDDLNRDIGISARFDQKVNALSEQELNGYTINGKKWHGIKGVTNELRQDVLNSIRDGVVNKESREQLKQRVKELFKTAKDSQSERIARTETNRFVNEGKLQGFMDSGAEGQKTWLIVDDADTSEICKRLQRKYGEKGVGFDEPFRDEKTGKEFMAPPAHVNCRSVLGYALPEKE